MDPGRDFDDGKTCWRWRDDAQAAEGEATTACFRIGYERQKARAEAAEALAERYEGAAGMLRKSMERASRLEAALRDECIDHPDGCRCRPCGLVFAPTKEGT